MSTHACERCEIDHPWRECEPWPESKGQMKTIAEMESELERVTKDAKAAWAAFKTKQAELDPLSEAWCQLDRRERQLTQWIEWRKEMETAK